MYIYVLYIMYCIYYKHTCEYPFHLLLKKKLLSSSYFQALLRPGRFDRHITIDLPTLVERKEIFTMYLKKLAIAQPPETYAGKLSQLSPGMSGKWHNSSVRGTGKVLTRPFVTQ